jgi:hypothetical protein
LLADEKLPADRRRLREPEDLEEEQSPWEERAIRRWKRWRIATDSSVEKSLEIEALSTSGIDRVVWQQAFREVPMRVEPHETAAQRVRPVRL